MGFFDKIKEKFNDTKALYSIEKRALSNEEITDEEKEFYLSKKGQSIDSYVKTVNDAIRIKKINKQIKKLDFITTDDYDFYNSASDINIETKVLEQIEKNIEKRKKDGFEAMGSIDVNTEFKVFKEPNLFMSGTEIPFSDVLSYSLNVGGKNINSKTTGGLSVGRALVGGVALGPVGAILGGVTGKRKTTQTEYVNDISIMVSTKKGLKKISIISTKTDTSSSSYKSSINCAQRTMNALDIIIDNQSELEEQEIYNSIKEEYIQDAKQKNLMR